MSDAEHARLAVGTPLATVTAAELVHEQLGEITWLIPSLAALGLFTVIYGAPKSGKTTLAMHMAASVVGTRDFLGGRVERPSPVLWLDLEQSRRTTRLRMIDVGAHRAIEPLDVWVGHPPTLLDLLATIEKLGVVMVVVDSLSRWLLLENENDNSEINRKIAPILTAFQARDVALVVIHHDRKSEGTGGRNLRGGGALLAMCDVACEVAKEQDGEPGMRRLSIVSRHEDDRKMLVKLTAHGYEDAGMPSTRQEERIMDALTASGPQSMTALGQLLDLTDEALRGRLEAMRKAGRITRTGYGKRGDPFYYSIPLTPQVSPRVGERATLQESTNSPHPLKGGWGVGEMKRRMEAAL
ncbi:MAG TPA: AAA family ATPase [Gemmatimonadaceae bacterium]|nr:AAA family ATPase [Gemmatimonadaceae bacterium]